MPYDETDDLPSKVKDKIKDKKKLRQFMHVVNAQLKSGKDEGVAFASAWSAVGKEKDCDMKKGQIDVIADIPDKVRAKLPSKDAKLIWMNSYNNSLFAGATMEMASIKAWASLQAAGYVSDSDGERLLMADLAEQNMVKRVIEWFKKKDENDEDYRCEETIDFELEAEITKKNEEKRLVYGWASVIEEDGNIVVDKQGDMISVEDLEEAAHSYISESREAHEMHKGEKKGETVESMVFTKDVQEALGIDLGKVGWFIVQKIHDDETWEKIKNGEMAAFSIGGRGVRIEDDQD